MSIIKDWKVYLVTDRLHARGRSTLEIVKAAVEGGVSVVQLREKNLGTRDFLNEGLLIRDFLKSKSVPLIINDRVDIALALDADGVHVGQEDMPVDMVRKLLGPEKIIGLSIQDLSQIDEIATENADYIAVSPIFPTPTKTTDSHWGIDGLIQVRRATVLPIVAIGSVNIENAGHVVQAGADSIAVVTAIVSADDPETATRSLVNEVSLGKNIIRNG